MVAVLVCSPRARHQACASPYTRSDTTRTHVWSQQRFAAAIYGPGACDWTGMRAMGFRECVRIYDCISGSAGRCLGWFGFALLYRRPGRVEDEL